MINDLLKVLLFIFIAYPLLATSTLDQWQDTDKTYKDLIKEGFEIKGYDTSSIKSQGGFTVLFFVTVLQKNKEVYECQEYQTLDIDMQTIDMSIVCRELIQPYNRGIGT